MAKIAWYRKEENLASITERDVGYIEPPKVLSSKFFVVLPQHYLV